ncbi:hypothetical protein BRD20_04695 [Halobacteriales archaeon SW_8_65_20]|nr:MAG: hypothetical protein BRD20_04695 [Halobacteriales archaeon SW_8_65_20]
MNKNLLAVAIIVLVAAVGVGATQLGGQGTSTPTPTPESPTPTATPAENGTATPTATPTSADNGTPTPTPTPTATPVPALDTDQIREQVERDIVAFQDDPTTATNEAMAIEGSVSSVLSAMARNHSQQMAERGRLAHTIGNSTTDDRYEQRPAIANCRVVTNQETYTVARESMEGIARVPRTDDSERDYGSRLVERLISDDHARRTLEFDDADQLGIGIAAGEEYVYVTIAVC